MFQFRRFPWYAYLFSIPCYIFNVTDCSIRTSADHNLLAIPRSFSQLTASFIGSQCQGILPALLLAWPFVNLSVYILVRIMLVSFLRNNFWNYSKLPRFLLRQIIYIFPHCITFALFSFQDAFDKFYSNLPLVGTSGLEPPTSRLSGVRSNQLSYAP